MNQATTTSPTKDTGARDAGSIARDGDAAARCALASGADTRPEILYFLAEDPDTDVRCRIAENAETPQQADMLLARDDCEEVRRVLATKIGRLFPEISATERNVMRRAVLDILEVLAADQTKRVRELVSDALKDAPDVPPHIVRQLAADPHLTVCGPILEYSPVLTEEDLLEIISSKPVQGALGAISRRGGVEETVSHAIAASEDVDAIADLLANPSAQIREETLDSLVESAPPVDAWHAPLVNRPMLPANAARRIAGFVAQSLLDTLRRRTDLKKDVLDAIETAVTARLEKEAEKAPAKSWIDELADPEPAGKKDGSDPHERVRKMNKEGRLNEKTIREAASAGDREFIIAALSICSGENHEAVNRIFEMRSTKGIVAICWKAEFSMDSAVLLQATVGAIAPAMILKPESGANYPMTEEEMLWRLEFFEADI